MANQQCIVYLFSRQWWIKFCHVKIKVDYVVFLLTFRKHCKMLKLWRDICSNIMGSVKTMDGFTNHLNANLGSDKDACIARAFHFFYKQEAL